MAGALGVWFILCVDKINRSTNTHNSRSDVVNSAIQLP